MRFRLLPALLPIAALATGVAALARFVLLAWFGLGFVPLALLALAAFLAVAAPLLRAGARRGVPVLVLHDGPGIPALAKLQRLPARPFDFLADEGYDVYYYDQLGAGLSSRIDLGADPAYTVSRHVQDLEGIRRALGAPQLFLIGEGWGATLAASYLVTHAEHVQQAVLESPAPVWFPAWPDDADPAARAKMTDVQATALALRQRHTPRFMVGRMVADFNSRLAHAVVEDWEADQWWTRLQQESLELGQPKMSCAGDPRAFLQPPMGLGFFAYSYTMRDALRVDDPRPVLSNVRVPALIIRDSCDHIDWRVSYEYLRTLPLARYVAIPAAGHLIWLDQPSLHGEVLRAFVAASRSRSSFTSRATSRAPPDGRDRRRTAPADGTGPDRGGERNITPPTRHPHAD